MSGRWSADAVAALSPDQASDRAARRLLAAGWSEEGYQGQVVWGACAGSGKHPYLVQADLSGPAYTCSCPSRKFPCKHTLALLLRWAAGTVPEADPPGRVSEWTAGRAARAQQAAGRARSTTTGPRATAPDTLARRQERVGEGLVELERWLGDLLGTGLATLRGQGPAPFDRMAARLVDAQAPGVAGRVRALPAVLHSGPQWAQDLATELGLLHLLAQAHARLAELDASDPALAASVRAHVGYPVSTETVSAQGARVRDEWSVHAWQDSEQDRLRRRVVHLQGRDTGRTARVLSFGPGTGDLDASLPVGTRLDAELAFYPGTVQTRALVAARHHVRPGTLAPRVVPLFEAGDARAAQLSADPWLPATQHWVRAVLHGSDGAWWLSQADGSAAVPVVGLTDPWTVLARTGGAPADHLVDWTRDGCRILTHRVPDGSLPR